MILEIAEYTVLPGRADDFAAGIARGLEVIRQAEGCLSAHVAASVEEPHEFALLIRWRSLDDHLVTFRNGPLFPAYRQHIAGLFADAPRVRHYPITE
jgi:quinol monooxygenase YgiN